MITTEMNCEYCGKEDGNLEWEHIIPRSKGGPDNIDNLVLSCKTCNLKKGTKNLYEWYDEEHNITRLALGKFLKILFEEYKRQEKLDCTSEELGYELNRSNLTKIFEK